MGGWRRRRRGVSCLGLPPSDKAWLIGVSVSAAAGRGEGEWGKGRRVKGSDGTLEERKGEREKVGRMNGVSKAKEFPN